MKSDTNDHTDHPKDDGAEDKKRDPDPTQLVSGNVESYDVQLTCKPVSQSNLISRYVLVDRDPAIQASRLTLPIVSEESRIMEEITDSDVVIICGATGCGKTTQIPQFLYEAGYTR